MKKPFEPNFNTPDEDLSKEEKNKLNREAVTEQLCQEMRNDEAKITWECEQIAKSNGIYLEFDRSVKGAEKNWFYMIRIANPGGGPITRKQWQIYDEVSGKYGVAPDGFSSLRATTRQTFQFHWVKKEGVIEVVRQLAEAGQNSLNGCGDNTRNVMACPLSRFSDVFNAQKLGHKLGEYFQLPMDPFIKVFAIDPNLVNKPKQSFSYGPKLLNRKFKIAVSTVHRDPNSGKIVADNCVEALTNDMAIAPIVENDVVVAYQLYVGGGQGERNGKPSAAALGVPLCIIQEDQLMTVCDGVVQTHQKIGDRQNRHWARLKYVIKKLGVDAFRKEVEDIVGFQIRDVNPDLDIGNRELHHGWTQQPSNGLWTYGLFIENGRIKDNSPNGKSKTMIREIMDKFDVELSLTASQDVLISNIPEAAKSDFEGLLDSYDYGKRNGRPVSTLRRQAGACVGLYTCRLSYTESEQFEPVLLDELEEMGWGDLDESIGITGCERQCYRPATKAIGLVGSGSNRYMFKLFGDKTARFQGRPLISSNGEELYLRSVPRDEVAKVIDVLLNDHKANANDGEGLGAYHRRIGDDAIIALLKDNESTAALLERPFNTACVLD